MGFKRVYLYFIVGIALFNAKAYALTTLEIEFLFGQYFQRISGNAYAEKFLSTDDKLKELSLEEAIRYLVALGREKGVYLIAHRIPPQTVLQQDILAEPLIAVLKGGKIVLIENIGKDKVVYMDEAGKRETLSPENFLEKWDGLIISQPLVNVTMEIYPFRKAINYYIIYSYHLEDFQKVSWIFDNAVDYASMLNKKIIYIDELGLIPYETVKNTMSTEGLSEKSAFDKIKKILQIETEKIGSGIPPYDSNPFFAQLYNYLAQRKVKAVLENLDYDNWRQIVQFDELDLLSMATNEFFNGDLRKAIDFMERYLDGFWKYNVIDRDRKFADQLRNILADNPDALIFIVRGIGHYGLGKYLHLQGYGVKEIVVGEGRFHENFACGEYYLMLKTNEINVDYGEGKELVFRNFIQGFLRIYFMNRYDNLIKSTVLSRRIVDRMTLKDLIEISFSIRKAMEIKPLVEGGKIYSFVYEWVKEKGFTSGIETEDGFSRRDAK